MSRFSIFFCFLIVLQVSAQENSDIKWQDVSKLSLHGRLSENTENPFQRFPESMKTKVRKAVWKLSQNPAGVNLRFTTTADKIIVKYEVEGEREFPHMPATGVSGIDLYVKNKEEAWKWVKGNFHFADTINYTFQLSKVEAKTEREFMLYLPLYASLKWMKIGLDGSNDFKVNSQTEIKPIAVYGTSITQGACASRPGNAWTSKLSRNTSLPILNFGFSGNGRLEPEIVNYLAHLPVQAYILDCLANFTSGQGLDDSTAYNRLMASVKTLRKNNPNTPIILTDHAGYPGGEIYLPKKKIYESLNTANKKALNDLKAQGIKKIYLLSYHQLNLTAEDFVDGVHPTDGGMEKYAKAYEKLLGSVLRED
ncbi:SGNH/GDSL hydrolase family protein [Gramella sp. AN32]|uniref:SGNH/GDSL hydrolase family protein n=1 Tax=Christiangramia antarctica TaxID=2058158 RepID=A0ABW5X1I8_9FLAO|nr:SGNH/GDSL hydrolase family protein [Gramella sp. AN32]MCM4157021.1 hydrolase [Gramella sp. AN32]